MIKAKRSAQLLVVLLAIAVLVTACSNGATDVATDQDENDQVAEVLGETESSSDDGDDSSAKSDGEVSTTALSTTSEAPQATTTTAEVPRWRTNRGVNYHNGTVDNGNHRSANCDDHDCQTIHNQRGHNDHSGIDDHIDRSANHVDLSASHNIDDEYDRRGPADQRWSDLRFQLRTMSWRKR